MQNHDNLNIELGLTKGLLQDHTHAGTVVKVVID